MRIGHTAWRGDSIRAAATLFTGFVGRREIQNFYGRDKKYCHGGTEAQRKIRIIGRTWVRILTFTQRPVGSCSKYETANTISEKS